MPKKQSPELGAQLEELFRQRAAEFVKQNAGPAAKLGSDVARAILFQQVLLTMPMVWTLPNEASLAQAWKHASVLKARDAVFAMVARAELENQTAVNELRSRAIETSLSIAAQVVQVVSSAAVSGLIQSKLK